MGMFSKVKKSTEENTEFETIETGANIKEEKDEVKSTPVEVKEEPVAQEPVKEDVEPKKVAEEVAATKADEKATKATKKKSAPAAEKPAKASSAPKKSEAEEKIETTEAAPAAESGEKVAYTGKFEIKRTKDDRFFFNLQASNRVYIATSQIYSSVQSAMVGIKSVINNAESAPVEDQTLKSFEPIGFPKWEIYLDKAEQFRFRLCASNGNCVCHSQGYTTKHNCKNGIQSIINSVKNAEIEKTYLIKDED